MYVHPCIDFGIQYDCSTIFNWFFVNSPPPDKMVATAQMIIKTIFVNDFFFVLIKISLKFVPKGPINNNPALV